MRRNLETCLRVARPVEFGVCFGFSHGRGWLRIVGVGVGRDFGRRRNRVFP